MFQFYSKKVNIFDYLVNILFLIFNEKGDEYSVKDPCTESVYICIYREIEVCNRIKFIRDFDDKNVIYIKKRFTYFF